MIVADNYRPTSTLYTFGEETTSECQPAGRWRPHFDVVRQADRPVAISDGHPMGQHRVDMIRTENSDNSDTILTRQCHHTGRPFWQSIKFTLFTRKHVCRPN